MRPATVTIFKILIELWQKLLFVKILILNMTIYLNVVVSEFYITWYTKQFSLELSEEVNCRCQHV